MHKFFEYHAWILFHQRLRILVIYDISDDKRRKKISDYLQGYGGRVQESAFEAFSTMRDYKKILKDIGMIIKKEEDSVRIYRLDACRGAHMLGKNTVISPEQFCVL